MKKEKIELTAQEKEIRRKKRRKTALTAVGIILSVLTVFIGVTSVITYAGNRVNLSKAQSFENAGTRQLKIEDSNNGTVNIYCDDELKVMQLTDVHIGGGWVSLKKDSMAINAVASMITEEKPDLVIVTGDLVYPMIFQAGTVNNFNGIKMLASLMESLGVYWTMIFGNHDVEVHSIHSYEDILSLLSSEEYPHCLLSTAQGNVDGYSNHVINILNSDKVITRSFVLFDTHAYVSGYIPGINWAYDNVHDNQVEWYKQVIDSINDYNEERFASLPADKATEYVKQFSSVSTTVFIHIPLTEYRDAWNEYAENGHSDTENVKFIYGVAGETDEKVYCGSGEDQYH